MSSSLVATGVQFPDSTIQTTAASSFGFKNRIINGAMMIDQRNAGASVTAGTTPLYTVDRWGCYGGAASKFTVQQNAGSVTPPTSFVNYLGCTSSSAYSLASTDIFHIYQQVEGFNVSDFGWGTASASAVTLSFWVRSSLTGTFGGSLRNSAGNRSYPFSYTISSANTWEQKSITVAGDTTGTWTNTNGVGVSLSIGLGVGSTYSGSAGAWSANNYLSATGATSVVGTSGATFYITGVQLEKGSTATSFDYRPYGTELALCQRYCEVVKPSGATNYAQMAVGACASTIRASVGYFYQVAKRSQPTVTYTAANTFALTNSSDGAVSATGIQTDRSDVTMLAMSVDVSSGLTGGNATRLLQNNSATPQITISAEL